LADFTCSGRSCFAAGGRGEKGAMFPIKRFCDERNDTGAPAAEEDGVNGNPFWILPFFSDNRTLFRRCGESGVWVSCRPAGLWVPGATQPVHQLGRFLVRHSFPPDITVRSDGTVGENRILGDSENGVRIRLDACSGRDTEESGFGINCVKAAV